MYSTVWLKCLQSLHLLSATVCIIIIIIIILAYRFIQKVGVNPSGSNRYCISEDRSV